MISLPANFMLGFLGAGQLARMSAQEAYKLGIQVRSFGNPGKLEPLDLITPHHHKGAFDDEDSLLAFARACDVITLENEFLDSDLLACVQEKSGTPIYPSPESFRLIESKFIEKETFADAGIPVASYSLVNSRADLEAFGQQYGWPYILKSSKGGYDGYGNEVVRNPDEALAGFVKLGGTKGHDILAEVMIPFERELAVQVARNETGIAVFPCCETIQENHICTKVIAPARIPDEIQKKAQEIAIAATEAIDGKGIFAYEFFLAKDGNLLLNESAPRPHNSGHYTIEGCTHSQFAIHVRAVLGLPLPQPKLTRKAAVMINLLGTQNRDSEAEKILPAIQHKTGYLHLYGKTQSRKGRKMGHFTLLGDNADVVLKEAEQITQNVEI